MGAWQVKRKEDNASWKQAVVLFMRLVVSLWVGLAHLASASQNEYSPVPLIDQQEPERIETASFGLG